MGRGSRSQFSRGGEGNPKPVAQSKGREILNHLCRGKRGNPRSWVEKKRCVGRSPACLGYLLYHLLTRMGFLTL